jgi:hypothetical protein
MSVSTITACLDISCPPDVTGTDHSKRAKIVPQQAFGRLDDSGVRVALVAVMVALDLPDAINRP